VTIQTSAVAIEGRFIEDEHRHVRKGLGALQETIVDAHRLSRPELVDRAARTLAWLRRDVLPHAAWEEAWFYSNVDTEAGTPWATRALRFEHEQIREVARALEDQFDEVDRHWTNERVIRLVVALTRLETLLAAHLVQEERLVLPAVGASA
jgi:hemerythrin-like domain-containing protein